MLNRLWMLLMPIGLPLLLSTYKATRPWARLAMRRWRKSLERKTARLSISAASPLIKLNQIGIYKFYGNTFIWSSSRIGSLITSKLGLEIIAIDGFWVGLESSWVLTIFLISHEAIASKMILTISPMRITTIKTRILKARNTCHLRLVWKIFF